MWGELSCELSCELSSITINYPTYNVIYNSVLNSVSVKYLLLIKKYIFHSTYNNK